MALAMTLGLARVAQAGIVTESVVYTIEGQPYEGYFAMNQGFGDNQPLVLIVHDWNGLDEYEMRRAQMLAEQGYAAFAVDLYGQEYGPATAKNRSSKAASSTPIAPPCGPGWRQAWPRRSRWRG